VVVPPAIILGPFGTLFLLSPIPTSAFIYNMVFLFLINILVIFSANSLLIPKGFDTVAGGETPGAEFSPYY